MAFCDVQRNTGRPKPPTPPPAPAPPPPIPPPANILRPPPPGPEPVGARVGDDAPVAHGWLIHSPPSFSRQPAAAWKQKLIERRKQEQEVCWGGGGFENW